MQQLQLIGILNVTPDSFSDGGLYAEADAAVKHALELHHQGAAFIDIGAESTRPGAIVLTPEEEWKRLEPVLTALQKHPEVRFSLDTHHPETVQRAAGQFGDFIVNDVTGMNDPGMIEAVVQTGLPCIISHLPAAHGQNIQAAHQAKLVDSETRVRDELLAKRAILIHKGVAKSKIILDPGIGFGKTPELNQKLLTFASLVPDSDVMIGYSRKRFLGEDRMALEPNLKAARIAANAGARYLRVHDVAGHAQWLKKSLPLPNAQ